MRILYGVCGEGYGHAFRSMTIAEHLEKKGHEVVILAHGKSYDVLKEKFNPLKIEGLNFVIENSRIRKRKTLLLNLRNFPKNIKKHSEFRNLIGKFKPDICITDFEPITVILSKIYRLPLISIDNEHSITHLKIKSTKGHLLNYFLAKNIVRSIVNRASYFIILSFSNVRAVKKNAIVVPPVLRPDIKSAKKREGPKIVVYLSRPDDNILHLLEQFKEEFVVFGYNVNKKKGNLEFKTRNKLIPELANCKAVIATSGFSLMSEAVYLDKPYFALPLKWQFEQFLNAEFLKEAGFGEYSENLKKEDLENFLSNLEIYKRKLRDYEPDHDKLFKVLDKILKVIK